MTKEYETEIDRLRAELSEARRLLDEARGQEPFGFYVTDSQHNAEDFVRGATFDGESTETVIPLYAAPVPAQPAVPDDVAERMAARLALVWRVATGRETDEERATLGNVSPNAEYDEFVAGIDAAILSATDTEGRKDGKG